MNGRRLGTLVLGSALACVAGLSAGAQDRTPAAPASSLYVRLGGYDFIAKFVDTAFPRVAAHTQLRRLRDTRGTVSSGSGSSSSTCCVRARAVLASTPDGR